MPYTFIYCIPKKSNPDLHAVIGQYGKQENESSSPTRNNQHIGGVGRGGCRGCSPTPPPKKESGEERERGERKRERRGREKERRK